MKKLLLVLSLLTSFYPEKISYSESFYYAKIDSNNVYFYSSPVKNDENKLFEIPNSYYVILSASENSEYYSAKYADLTGYVLKSSVVPIKEIPNYPFASTSFRVFSSTNIYQSPSFNSEKLCDINLIKINTYYGVISGEEAISDTTNLWYYCSYTKNEENYTGYVYSYFCDKFQTIEQNNEVYTPVDYEIFTNLDANYSTANLSILSKILIGLGVSIPCLIILIILLRKKSLHSEKPKRIIHRPRKDFYELSDDDI